MDCSDIEKKRYLTVEETAKYLGIAPGTIRNKIMKNPVTPFPVQPKRIGKSVRFDRRKLDRYMEAES